MVSVRIPDPIARKESSGILVLLQSANFQSWRGSMAVLSENS
jgi:hypothetical protein